MSLSAQFLDELRARTLISSVIAPSVKLVRAGREWKACCPFHQEKTPSFTVNDDKGFYHCFGCGAHGDAIRFLTEARGLTFIDAVKELAAKAGMELPAPDPRQAEKAERAASLFEVMAAAQAFYAAELSGRDGGEARDLLARRGIGEDAVARFGLGYAAPGRTRLKSALAGLGEERLVEAGLLIRPEDGGGGGGGGETYDRFRGRLMIPIRDPRGRVIAFGGRIVGDGEPHSAGSGQAKYLNSPDTPLFDKGRTLYNLDLAAPAARASRRLILVEGYLDVIALSGAGIAEVVAPLGTAVTESQIERLWRLDPAPILCFDGDQAGRKAAVRAALRALPGVGPERTLRFVTLPAGQDPDDVVRSGGGAAFEALVAEPESLADHLWRHEHGARPLATPEERAALKQRLMAHAGTIADPDVRHFYRHAWLERFDRLFERVRDGRRDGWRDGRRDGSRQRQRPRGPAERGRFPGFEPPASAAARAIGSRGIDASTARAVLQGVMRFPQLLDSHSEAIAALVIADRRLARLRDRLLDAAVGGAVLDRPAIATICEEAEAGIEAGAAIGFSFLRSDCEPRRAVSDLASAIEALVAEGEFSAALAEATERLQAGEEQAFDEQRRLHAAREEITQWLASLATSE